MKTIPAILIFITVLLFGCDTSPDLSVNNSEDNDPTSLYKTEIPLPNKSPLWEDSVLTMSQEIDGSVGGRMIMEKYYIAENGDSVLIKADLTIPKDAFQATVTFTMTVDKEDAAIHFYPTMAFAETLKLFQSFEGLNLENYQTGTIDFVFIADDGSIELVKKNGTQVIIPQGILRVQNAKLIHFSRYGWVRKSVSSGKIYPYHKN